MLIRNPLRKSLLAAGFATLLVWTANAQNIGSPEQLSEVAILKQQIDDLEKRLRQVEEKFEKPMTVRAPFTVADAGGNPVMRVSNTSGRSITLGSEASPIFKVAEQSEGVHLDVSVGGAHAGLKAFKNGSSIVIAANSDGPYARFSVSPGNGAATEIVDGPNRAQIGIVQGTSRVKLWKADKQFFLVDSTSAPSLKLGDADKPALLVEDATDQARLNLGKSQSKIAMTAGAASGTTMFLEGGTGQNVAISALQARALLEVQSPGDNYIQMVTDGPGPALILAKGDKTMAHLGTPEGRNTGLRIYDQAGELALQAGLGTGKEELASVALFKGENEVGKLFSSFTGEGALQINRPNGQPAAQLGRIEEGKATALRIFDNGGQIAVGAGIDSDNNPAVRIASKGKLVANMSADTQGRGRIDILEGGKTTASLSSDEDGDASLTLKNKAGAVAATLGTQGAAGSLDLYKIGGKLAAQLGPASVGNTALRIFGANDSAIAAIGIDAEGLGAVRIGNSAGAVVASMQASKTGGGIYAISDSVPVAGMVAEGDRGVIAVYNNSTPVAFMTRSSAGDGGNITTALNNGFGVFSAGAAQDGAGEACINRKTQAGTARLACLGLGLPSAGMGK